MKNDPLLSAYHLNMLEWGRGGGGGGISCRKLVGYQFTLLKIHIYLGMLYICDLTERHQEVAN